MYERSAIVLERFFINFLGLNQVNNLKQNFTNYCQLFDKFQILQQANLDEIYALNAFQNLENKIEEIQANEEKLYKRNAKLEYNRDLVFQDITLEPEEIEKCIIKLEGDVQKNQEKLVSLRKEFVETVRDYNQKKLDLAKFKKSRKNAENDYNTIFEETKKNYENISEEYIETAKSFSQKDIQEEIISTLAENGKGEKIPFNNQVITNAAKIGFDIWSREIECYLEAYKLTQKLVNELLDGAVSVELHEKTIRNISAKISFLEAEKEYIVGFLDYERITVIYGKRMHRSLMIDACEKLDVDIEQVENLYQLLLKEIADKSSKKAYKELYNKSYLMEMEDKDAKFKKEKNRVNLSTGTIMNSNYWRIEGIKNIYTVFYKNVVEVFGKDLDEFEIPKVQDENLEEDINSEVQEFVPDSEIIEIEENSKTVNVVEANSESNLEQVSETKIEKIEHAAEESSAFSDLESRLDIFLDEIEDLEETKPAKKIEKAKIKTETEIEKETEKVVEITAEPEFEKNQENRKTLKLHKIVKRRGRKKVRHYTRQVFQSYETSSVLMDETKPVKESKLIENSNMNDKVEINEVNESAQENDIFGEKYRDIALKIDEIDELDDLEDDLINKKETEERSFEKEDYIFEEESIFDSIEEEDNIDFDEIDLEEKTKKKKSKNKIFDSFRKINSKSKKKITNE